MSDWWHTVQPGERVRLAEIDPRQTGGFGSEEESETLLEELEEKLEDLQRAFYAEAKHSILIVLQAMDAAGKDGTIRHVAEEFDPQGVEVTSFKVPSAEELAHDYLWRVHKATPRKGMIGVFNRSHYEDVLVVRVKNLVPEPVWRQRYEQINQFEKMLTENGTTIVKIYLHISPDEQAERFRSRQVTPRKQWKFSPGDLEDRKLWADYMAAYEDALTRCSTEWASWHIVPAGRKWFRNLAVSRLLVDTLERLDPKYPDPVEEIDSYEIPEVDWP